MIIIIKVLLGIGAVLLIDLVVARFNKKPKIIYKDRLIKNYNAQTMPPFFIRIQEEDKDNKVLLKHELVHWEQYRKTGALIFNTRYFLEKLIYGYDKMPMEIEARKLSGEKEECITNYTECVRDGRSNTIVDPEFRT